MLLGGPTLGLSLARDVLRCLLRTRTSRRVRVATLAGRVGPCVQHACCACSTCIASAFSFSRASQNGMSRASSGHSHACAIASQAMLMATYGQQGLATHHGVGMLLCRGGWSRTDARRSLRRGPSPRSGLCRLWSSIHLMAHHRALTRCMPCVMLLCECICVSRGNGVRRSTWVDISAGRASGRC